MKKRTRTDDRKPKELPSSDPISDFPTQLRAAEAHLSATVPSFAQIITTIGPCSLAPEPDLFRVMVRAMIAQLISTAAAKSINTRLETALKGKIIPSRLLALTDDEMRACGISGNKAKAIRGLAEHFRTNRRFGQSVATADDLTARKLLLPLHGVGPWTVDMVLMFAFSRLDILPVGDLGLRAGVRDLYGLSQHPTASELTAIAEPWRPYRSVATWYIWRYRGWAGKWNA